MIFGGFFKNLKSTSMRCCARMAAKRALTATKPATWPEYQLTLLSAERTPNWQNKFIPFSTQRYNRYDNVHHISISTMCKRVSSFTTAVCFCRVLTSSPLKALEQKTWCSRIQPLTWWRCQHPQILSCIWVLNTWVLSVPLREVLHTFP